MKIHRGRLYVAASWDRAQADKILIPVPKGPQKRQDKFKMAKVYHSWAFWAWGKVYVACLPIKKQEENTWKKFVF